MSHFVERVLEAAQQELRVEGVLGLVVVDDLPFEDLRGPVEDLVELPQLLLVVHDVPFDLVDGLQLPIHPLAELIEEVGGPVRRLLLDLLIVDRSALSLGLLRTPWRLRSDHLSIGPRILLSHWCVRGLLHFDLLEFKVARGGAEGVGASLVLIVLLGNLLVVFLGLGF